MAKCGIYGWRNMVNGKWYVGQSVDMLECKQTHLWKAKAGKHHNRHFQAAFVKYGESNFEFHFLEEVPENMLDVRERAWIGYYKSCNRNFGYNLDDGGGANRHCSSETKRKLSEASMGNTNMLGKTFSMEHRKRLSDAKMGAKNHNYGKHRSDKTRSRISMANSGYRPSADTRRKMSDARRLRPPVSDETRRRLSESAKKDWVKRKVFNLGS
jgi:group I intron endonuclease